MKNLFNLPNKLPQYCVIAVLALVPFYAFLTVFGSSLVGHYTLLRLWDDILAVVLAAIVSAWLVKDTDLARQLGRNLIVRLICAYIALSLLLGIISLLKDDVDIKALAYGLLVNIRYFVWFLAVSIAVQKTDLKSVNWQKLVLGPGAAVALFALLQYTVLPHHLLSHVGYNKTTTIAPIETINNNSQYIRAQSTLRGANPLGAYLVIIASVIGATLLRARRKLVYTLLAITVLIALYASGSRSAWLGTVLALLSVGWLQLRTTRSKIILGNSLLAGLLLFGGIAFLFRNNTGFENALLHTQKNSAVVTGSNSAHASALRTGLTDVAHQPFGDGPGTAGPASVYNGTHPARIAENYYVQIAQETGWLGLALFVSIVVLTGAELYRLSNTSRLALALFASLLGISFVNMLSHAWADDTLAFLWWGLTGIAFGLTPQLKARKQKHEVKT